MGKPTCPLRWLRHSIPCNDKERRPLIFGLFLNPRRGDKERGYFSNPVGVAVGYCSVFLWMMQKNTPLNVSGGYSKIAGAIKSLPYRHLY